MAPRLLLALALFVLSPARAFAAGEPPTREEQARRHYDDGDASYRAGRYAEALEHFKVGYALSPRPEFLINFAQTYRKLGEYERATVECERYLATAPPPALAAETRRLMAAIREEQAARAAESVREPAPPPVPVVLAPPSLPPVAEPVPPRRRGRAWVWGVVAGAAVVIAGGVALGIVLSSTREIYPAEPLGRTSFR